MQPHTPNLQLYCLARRVGLESAYVVGLERAIGDIIITMDACSDPTSPMRLRVDWWTVPILIRSRVRGHERPRVGSID